MGATVSKEQARKLEVRLLKEQKPWHTPAQAHGLRKMLQAEFDRTVKRGSSKAEAFQAVKRRYANAKPKSKKGVQSISRGGAATSPTKLAVFGVKKNTPVGFAAAKASLEAQIAAYRDPPSVAVSSTFKFKRLVAAAAAKHRAVVSDPGPTGSDASVAPDADQARVPKGSAAVHGQPPRPSSDQGKVVTAGPSGRPRAASDYAVGMDHKQLSKTSRTEQPPSSRGTREGRASSEIRPPSLRRGLSSSDHSVASSHASHSSSGSTANGKKGKELLGSALNNNVPTLDMQTLSNHVAAMARTKARLVWAAIRAAVRQTRRYLLHEDRVSSNLSKPSTAQPKTPSGATLDAPSIGNENSAAGASTHQSQLSIAEDMLATTGASGLGQQIIREGELNSLEQTMGHYESTRDYFLRRLRLNLHKSIGAGSMNGSRFLTTTSDSSNSGNTSTRYTLLQKIGQGAFGFVLPCLLPCWIDQCAACKLCVCNLPAAYFLIQICAPSMG